MSGNMCQRSTASGLAGDDVRGRVAEVGLLLWRAHRLRYRVGLGSSFISWSNFNASFRPGTCSALPVQARISSASATAAVRVPEQFEPSGHPSCVHAVKSDQRWATEVADHDLVAGVVETPERILEPTACTSSTWSLIRLASSARSSSCFVTMMGPSCGASGRHFPCLPDAHPNIERTFDCCKLAQITVASSR
jgi:hypothetical protein